MKAALVESPGKLVVRDIPRPAIGGYQALCRLLYGATCTGTDQHLLHGRFPWPPQYPTVLGHESIGRVVETGPQVRYLHCGDLVTRVGCPADPQGGFGSNWGGFAEYGVACDHRAAKEDGRPESEWSGSRVNQVLPADFDPAASTMIITWRETLSFIRRLGVGPGRRLLVLGSGGNGLAFVAHGANLGAACVALTGSPRREACGRAAGAQAYYDYARPDLSDAIKKDHPQGFDFIIDAVGRKGMLDAVLPQCARGGSAAIYGIDDFGQCTLNPTRARGTFTFFNGGYDEAETHEAVIAFIRAGKLQARHWLDVEHPLPLERIAEAYHEPGKRAFSKALVRLEQ
ncbi:MAG: zinc-binding dehydrogenase [Planctomycetota bacterium]